MDKSLIAHAVLAVAAGIAAYAAWNRPTPGQHDPNVVVVAGSLDRLTEVDWDEPSYHVTIDRHGDAASLSATNKVVKDDKRNIADFPLSDKGRELVAKLAPLMAERSLGKPEAAQMKEVGLETPTQSLTLHFGEKVAKLEIGTSTYGSGSFYVRNGDGEVFLLPSQTLSPLKSGAPALIERMIVNLSRDHVEQITLKEDGASRTLVHKNAGERAQSFFADINSPADKLDKASSWVDAVLRLRVLNAAPEIPAAEPKLTVSVRGDDGKERVIRLWEPVNDTAVVTSQSFPKGVLIAKSTADMIFKDGKAVLTDGMASEPDHNTRAAAP